MKNQIATNLIEYSHQDAIAILTINRPEKRNALTTDMMWELGNGVTRFIENHEHRVAIITGAGENFSAGGDMAEMLEFEALSCDERMRAWQYNLEIIERSPKPIIASVHGAALGGGTEIAIACHIRVASENAFFSQSEIALDHIPGGGGTQRLPRLIPLTHAYEHLLLGEHIDAQKALRLGLVSHIWPDESLAEQTLTLAAKIAARSPQAIRYTMEAIRYGLTSPLDTGMRLERAFAALVGESQAAKQGLIDFNNKKRKGSNSDD